MDTFDRGTGRRPRLSLQPASPLATPTRVVLHVPQFYLDTPLHFAAAGGHEAVVTYLLSQGADKAMFNRVRAPPL
jgi:hypothetical protein